MFNPRTNGQKLGNPHLQLRESLPSIRERELEEACKVIGITDLRKMGLRQNCRIWNPTNI